MRQGSSGPPVHLLRKHDMTDNKAVMQRALDALVMVRDIGVIDQPLTQDQWDIVYNTITPLFELIERSEAIAQPVPPTAEPLTKDEIQECIDLLAEDHPENDFESDCPACTAHRKLKAMLAQSVQPKATS